MAVNGDQPRLGCGRLADDVWAGADDPPTAHETGCLFCQRARASMHRLAEASEALSAHEEESPEYTPGRHVKDLVMQLAHVELRRSQPIPLLTPDPPSGPAALTVSEQAVLDVIWRTSDALPGVRARHCAVHLDPADQQPGRPATVEVDLTVIAATGVSIPGLVERLRTHLTEQLAEETGLIVRRVSVAVEDLYDV